MIAEAIKLKGRETMTEKNTALIVRQQIKKEIRTKHILSFIGFFLLGAVLSTARLPMNTMPLGVGTVCAVTYMWPGALMGVCLGSILMGEESIMLAALASAFIRIISYVPRNAFGKGFRMIDSSFARIVAAAVGGACIGLKSFIDEPSALSALSAVFTVCTAVSSAVVFSFIFDKSYKYSTLSPVGFIAVSAGVTAAFSDVFIAGVPAALIIASSLTLFTAFERGGAYGAAAGLALGLPMGIETAVILALTGGAAGFFKRIGAFPAELTSISVYISGIFVFFGTGERFKYIIPIMIAEALTSLPYALGKCNTLFPAEHKVSIGNEILSDMKENENKNRMEMLSSAMISLSEIFSGFSEKLQKPEKLSLESLCRGVFKRNCESCPIECRCHDLSTITGGDTIDVITEKLMSSGKLNRERIGEYVSVKCPKTEKIISEINEGACKLISSAFQTGRADLFALDYEATAAMISNAISKSNTHYETDKLLSEKLRRALIRCGFAAENLIVCGNRKRYVIATGDELLRSSIGADDILRVCENVCMQKFTTPKYRIENGQAALILEADTKYVPHFAGRQCTKRGEIECGDAVSVTQNRDGYFYCFVCDGMGSGDIAALTSRICRVFLEKMLSCSNGKMATLEMMNTFIRNKGVECYATVDLLEIDMILGIATFVKCGATPSYVKRGDNIFKIESNTFPIGIMAELSTEMTEFELKDGDVIIMCSDGVAQDFDLTASLDPSWFVGFLEENWTDDVDEMAERIINAASEQNHRSDDMTVELIKVTRKDAPSVRASRRTLKEAE